jgi:hypothetical protein
MIAGFLFWSKPQFDQVRGVPLFSCYTGLAFADVKKLKRTSFLLLEQNGALNILHNQLQSLSLIIYQQDFYSVQHSFQHLLLEVPLQRLLSEHWPSIPLAYLGSLFHFGPE